MSTAVALSLWVVSGLAGFLMFVQYERHFLNKIPENNVFDTVIPLFFVSVSSGPTLPIGLTILGICECLYRATKKYQVAYVWSDISDVLKYIGYALVKERDVKLPKFMKGTTESHGPL